MAYNLKTNEIVIPNDNEGNDTSHLRISGGGINYYPDVDDNEFVKKITTKKEFLIHRKQKLYDENFKSLAGNYLPSGEFELLPHQKFARTFINPETPYKSALLFHDTGTGKTLSAIAIAESFKDHILGLRRNGKTAWVYIIAETAAQNRFYDELIGKAMKQEYLSYADADEYFRLQRIPDMDRNDGINNRIKEIKRHFMSKIRSPKKNGIYKFLTFREFQNHTIGRRNKEEGRTQLDADGNIIRVSVVDEIKNLNNSLLIIDEAHRTEGNDWMVSIRSILSKSKNTRVVLMTATPMYHTSSEIIEILSLLAEKEIDKSEVFTKDSVIKKDGIDTIKKYARGRILYLRGKDPEKFPKVIHEGTLPPKNLPLLETGNEVLDAHRLIYTPIIRIPMSKFHYETYESFDGKLSSETRMITDIALPRPKNNLGFFEKKGLIEINNASKEWKDSHGINVYKDSEGTLRLTGKCFEYASIGKYSAKYQRILSDLFAAKGKVIIYEELIEGLGINLFTEILIINGYTPIKFSVALGVTSVKKEEIRCYHCAQKIAANAAKGTKKAKGDHVCSPAYFAVLVGTGESKMRQDQILSKYNEYANINGAEIKIILGSSVIKESIDFKDVRHMMLINYQHNFSSIRQIEGRAARNFSHIRLPEEDRNVRIYKYISTVPGDKKESLEELKYRREEFEHINIQRIARALKEVSVDCAINKVSNIIPNEKNNTADCDYQICEYSCEYTLPDVNNDKLQRIIDTDTYFKHEKYLKFEVGNYIKKLFKFDVVYDIATIIEYIHKSNKFPFVIDPIILDTLMYFINQKIPVRNAYGTEGYLITIKNLIFFQPLGISENVTVQERRLPKKSQDRLFISISDYIESKKGTTFSKKTLETINIQLGSLLTRPEVGKALGENSLTTQVLILNQAIEDLDAMMHKKEKNIVFTKENVFKILSNYNKYLITDASIADATIDDDDINKPDNIFSKNTPSGIIGHHFNNTMSCYLNGEWSTCPDKISNATSKRMEDNDYIIGYIDKTKIGKFVFKLKFTKSEQTDKRKNNKGFVCTQINNKNLLLDIAKNLGVTQNLIDVNIIKICDILEIVLRDKEEQEAKKEKPKKYFYEYL